MFENFAEVITAGSADDELLRSIDADRLPRHVAIIMDGNGRWAAQRAEKRVYSATVPEQNLSRAIVDTMARLETKAVTLYAFSTENWKRPRLEISGLMQMLKSFLKAELDSVHRNNLRFQAIGDLTGLDKTIQRELAAAMEKTANNTGTVLNVALNYGGRAEIVEACKKAIKDLADSGRTAADLTETDIENNLYTYGLPEVDLMIRTSGEMRISNFLLWQLAYSEIYVTPTLFPDFRRNDIFKAIIDFQKRDRRFGGVNTDK